MEWRERNDKVIDDFLWVIFKNEKLKLTPNWHEAAAEYSGFGMQNFRYTLLSGTRS